MSKLFRIIFSFLNQKAIKNYSPFQGNFFVMLTISIASALLVACDRDDDNDNNNVIMYIVGYASASYEVPPNTSTATANLLGTYNPGNNSLNYTINWTGLSGTAIAAHFHGPAIPGVAPSIPAAWLVDLAITTNGVNGTASGTLTVADSVETALLNEKAYYNIHTALYPNGEIRGQVRRR